MTQQIGDTPSPPNPKPIYKSKTAYAAVLIAVLSLPELQTVINTLPEERRGLVFLVIATTMLILRYVTTDPVTLK